MIVVINITAVQLAICPILLKHTFINVSAITQLPLNKMLPQTSQWKFWEGPETYNFTPSDMRVPDGVCMSHCHSRAKA